MIDIFHASGELQQRIAEADDERMLIKTVQTHLDQYQLATRVKHQELDIAFAATGGPSQWFNADCMSIDFSPAPERATQFGDILVEQANGFVNLSTPAGFIPLVDVVVLTGQLHKKQLN